MTDDKRKECIVCVKSVQTGADGEKQVMETKSEGRLSGREGVLYVLYTENPDESDKSGAAQVKNLLRIEENPVRVNLTKSGAVSWKILFEQGKRNHSEYETPYGALNIGVETSSVKLEKDRQKISLQLMYALFIQGEKQADCRLEILIK